MHGHAPFHLSLQRTHTQRRALQQSATLSGNSCGRHTAYMCADVFAFSVEEQGDDPLRRRDVCWKTQANKTRAKGADISALETPI